MSTIFLDRDGVINENRSDYVKSWSEFRFLPGSKEAIAMLTKAGHRIIVCTNQAGIARGILSRDTVEEIHRRMVAEIAQVGGKIERVYYCPHAKEENCFCRKPRPGMLLRARDELGIDMHDAIFIGDSISDICAALAASVHPILVLTGLGMDHLREYCYEVHGPFLIAESLKHTAEMILRPPFMRAIQSPRLRPSHFSPLSPLRMCWSCLVGTCGSTCYSYQVISCYSIP